MGLPEIRNRWGEYLMFPDRAYPYREPAQGFGRDGEEGPVI
jgi:hypothetical protein